MWWASVLGVVPRELVSEIVVRDKPRGWGGRGGLWRRFPAGADHLFYLFFDLATNCTKDPEQISSQCSQSDILAIRWGGNRNRSPEYWMGWLQSLQKVQCGYGADGVAVPSFIIYCNFVCLGGLDKIKDARRRCPKTPAEGCPCAPRTSLFA